MPPGAGVICVNNIIYIAGGVIGQATAGGGYSPILSNQVWKLEIQNDDINFLLSILPLIVGRHPIYFLVS